MPKRSSKPPKSPRTLSSKSASITEPARLDEPGDGAERAARLVGFGRHARVLGVLWVVLGAGLATLGGVNLARSSGAPAADPAATRLLIVLMVYGLGLIVTGAAAYRRSVRVILVGMGLSLAPVIYGYVAIPVALIILASRAVRLAGLPRRRSPAATFLGTVLSRVAVGVIAGYLGVLAGGVAGGVAGGTVGAVAALIRLRGLGSLVDLLAVASLGVIGSAASSGFAALVTGLTSGRPSSRVLAVAHLGGLTLGVVVLVAWVLNNVSGQLGSPSAGRSEFALILILAAISAALGTGIGASLGTRFARFLHVPTPDQV